MNKVEYRKFFKQELGTKCESTRQVVDSLLKYERLLNYRFRLTKGNNFEYWFLSNKLDELYQQFRFYDYCVVTQRHLTVAYLTKFLRTFRTDVLTVYDTRSKVRKAHVVRDSLKLLDKWLIELDTMIKSKENVEN